MLNCELKEYQLKGLNWLANLYEQGINGILADEMGLGKVCDFPSASLQYNCKYRVRPQTVQSIAVMAYLAEKHNIWGPFLVVAPASTLHNWQQEITRFVPGIKALPYWGNVKDRATLRKFWQRKSLRYDKDAPFHVLITSYQLVSSACVYSDHFVFIASIDPDSIGRCRRKVLSARQVAVYDPGRGASYQVIVKRPVEDASELQLPQSSLVDGHADPELDARALGVASLYHAQPV